MKIFLIIQMSGIAAIVLIYLFYNVIIHHIINKQLKSYKNQIENFQNQIEILKTQQADLILENNKLIELNDRLVNYCNKQKKKKKTKKQQHQNSLNSSTLQDNLMYLAMNGAVDTATAIKNLSSNIQSLNIQNQIDSLALVSNSQNAPLSPPCYVTTANGVWTFRG